MGMETAAGQAVVASQVEQGMDVAQPSPGPGSAPSAGEAGSGGEAGAGRVQLTPEQLQRLTQGFLMERVPMALEEAARLQQHQKAMQQQQQQQEQPGSGNSGQTGQEPSHAALQILLRVRQQAAGILELLQRSRGAAVKGDSAGEAQDPSQQAALLQQLHISALQMEQLKETIAALDYRMGAMATETANSALAARFLSSALQEWDTLPLPEQGRARRIEMLLDALNTLAALSMDQNQHQVAEGLLLRAHAIYQLFKRDKAAASEPGELASEAAANVESQYTFTSFFLAQVYAAQEQRAKSAFFCGQTLTRQLQLRHHYSPLEWVFNCTQLASYYMGAANLNCALRCLSASKAVLEGAGIPTSLSADKFAPPKAAAPASTSASNSTSAAAASSPSAVSNETRDKELAAAANIAVGTARIFLRVLQDSVEKVAAAAEGTPDSSAPAAPQQGLGQAAQGGGSEDMELDPESKGQSGGAAGKQEGGGASAGEDALRFAGGAVGGGAGGDGLAAIEAAVARGPDFSSLGVSVEGQLPGGVPNVDDVSGRSGTDEAEVLRLVQDYPSGVVVFNRAMVNFKAALEYYKAEDFFSDHVAIVLDISALHKNLAYFEPSAHRAALIQQRAATRLEPLVPQINLSIYPQQMKQICYELASIHMSVLDLEDEAGRPVDKMDHNFQQAFAFFEHVDSRLTSHGANIPDEYHQLYANNLFVLASTHHRRHKLLNPQDGSADKVASAVPDSDNLRNGLQFFRRFLQATEHFQLNDVLHDKVAVAQEMVELLPAQLEMQLQRLSIS